MNKRKAMTKSRNWQCIVYPESAPENWDQIIYDLMIPGFISPLHDKDIQPDGTMKKPHYHVILIWDGPTTYNNAKKIMESFGGVVQPIPIQSMVGATRYLCHLDDPDKHRYPVEDVVCLRGTDYHEQISKNANDTAFLKSMFHFIEKNDITEYCDLIDLIIDEAMDDFFTLATRKNTLAINAYLTSRRHKGYIRKDKASNLIRYGDNIVDRETGEIFGEVDDDESND